MPKATHLSRSIPVPPATTDQTDGRSSDFSSSVAGANLSRTTGRQSAGGDFVSVALFSGIGLLISLVAILSGLQASWY
jgi:hypothetical protein